MKGTFISERSGRVDRLLDRLSERYGVCLQMVEVTGKRWSHVAGGFDDDPPSVPPARIPIYGRYWLFAGGWDRMPEGSRGEVLDSIRMVLKGEADGEE